MNGDTASEIALQSIRERVLEAARSGTALRLRGAGSKDFYGEQLEGEPLELSAYRGIVDYEPSELVMTARCGTPLSEIERVLAERGQFLAFEPPAFDADPTIGGVVAAGLSGPRRMQVGAVRDFVLGATLLNGEAELLHFGGRVMKNVAGFDVSRLLCGSLGILGILCEVSIKVLPRPRCEQTVCLKLSEADALSVFNRWGSLPLPISAATWIGGTAWVRLSGAVPAVRAAQERIGGESVDALTATNFWSSLRHYRHVFFSQPNIWRVSVPSTAQPLSLPGTSLMDWGGALRWHAGELDGRDVRSLATACGGTALCWRGSNDVSRFHPLSPAVLEIHRRLKQRFDPRGVFNRGRLVRGW